MIQKEKVKFLLLKELWGDHYKLMTTFCILEKNNEMEIVKIGFSWKAFFFNFVWGLSHKIWFFSSIWLSIFIALITSSFLSLISIDSFLFYLVFSSFFWGIYGNDILLFYLVKKDKYIPKKMISSSNLATAFYSYFLER